MIGSAVGTESTDYSGCNRIECRRKYYERISVTVERSAPKQTVARY